MRTVQAEIAVAVPTVRAIAAFLNPGDLRAWWGVERALIEPCAGGLYAIAWGISSHGFQFLTTGIVGVSKVDRLLRIDHYTYFNPERPILGPMSLTVSAKAYDGKQTLLQVVQDGYGNGSDWDWYYESVRTAWPNALMRLQRHLADTVQSQSVTTDGRENI